MHVICVILRQWSSLPNWPQTGSCRTHTLVNELSQYSGLLCRECECEQLHKSDPVGDYTALRLVGTAAIYLKVQQCGL